MKKFRIIVATLVLCSGLAWVAITLGNVPDAFKEVAEPICFTFGAALILLELLVERFAAVSGRTTGVPARNYGSSLSGGGRRQSVRQATEGQDDGEG